MLSKVKRNWMDVKRGLLAVDKTEQTVRIVEKYRDYDFILLQEATAALVPALELGMPTHNIHGGARGQDSLILTKRGDDASSVRAENRVKPDFKRAWEGLLGYSGCLFLLLHTCW